ncbi:MAG: hypothetical protein ACFFE8_01375 [Candidatus Heimdallarchaeota archaeon]
MTFADLNSVSVAQLDPSWIPILRELYWDNKIDIWLSKGYVSLRLTEEERKRWKISERQSERIEAILQEKSDHLKGTTEAIKLIVLKSLGSVESIQIPNQIDSKGSPLYPDLTQLTPETQNEISKEIQSVWRKIQSRDFDAVTKDLEKWDRKNHFPSLKKAGEIIAKTLKMEQISLTSLTFQEITSISPSIVPFLLLIDHFYNPQPDLQKLESYRRLLLLKKEPYTRALDFILYASWRNYPEEMFVYTKEWVESQEPYLVDWLIHGVEVPGRSQPRRALGYLRPVLNISDENVEWILKHVVAQLIGAAPFEALQHLIPWLGTPSICIKTKDLIENALEEIIEDKIVNNNVTDEDFPDLDMTLESIMNRWLEKGTEVQSQIAVRFLEKLNPFTNP